VQKHLQTSVGTRVTKNAIMKFQDSLGAPATGELTVEQLQRLFVMDSDKAGANKRPRGLFGPRWDLSPHRSAQEVKADMPVQEQLVCL
jgi:hypothetical protein